MPKILASVKNLNETKALIHTKVDIIDLKDPSNGALGRLNITNINKILDFAYPYKITSSTIGDLPNDLTLIRNNVDEISNTNINFIKIGVYDKSYIKTLCNIKSKKKLIAVFFADRFIPNKDEIYSLKLSGFSGVMIDTAKKDNGNIFSYIPINTIKKFLEISKSFNLVTGIAGSINENHLDDVIYLNPNYMGFRGAFCENKIRHSSISLKKVNYIIEKVNQIKAAREINTKRLSSK